MQKRNKRGSMSIPLTKIIITPADDTDASASHSPLEDDDDDDEAFRRDHHPLAANTGLNNYTLRISPQASRRNSECDPDDQSDHIPIISKNRGSVDIRTHYGAIHDNDRLGVVTTQDQRSRLSSFAAEAENHSPTQEKPQEKGWLSQVKTAIIFILVVICSVIIAVEPEKDATYQMMSVSSHDSRWMNIAWPQNSKDGSHAAIAVFISGALQESNALEEPYTNVTFVLTQSYFNKTEQVKEWQVYFSLKEQEITKENSDKKAFTIDSSFYAIQNSNLSLQVFSQHPNGVGFTMHLEFISSSAQYAMVYAALILIFVYVLIIFELVHRCLAAIVGSMMVVALLSAYSMRPHFITIINWIDFETLTLLFGMMVMVSIFCETGFFDWIALQAYKLARGKTWPLMIILCLVAAVVSSVLDNVTTILLLSPVTIRLCEALRLDPKRLLIAEVIFSNIGGTATAVGDPPNVIIVSSDAMQKVGVNFANFTLHMLVGILFVLAAAFALLFVLYRNLGDPDSDEDYALVELRREIEVWKRTAFSVSVVTKEEERMKNMLMQKVNRLNGQLKSLKSEKNSDTHFQLALRDIETKYCITNKWLLVKCSIIMTIVIIVFFGASLVDPLHLDLGWIAFMGAVWLLVLADFAELESILHRVEWATLIFFAALFTLMHGLEYLGLISWIGDQVSALILNLSPTAQLPVAIILIVWVSALASSFIDNIPFTTTMIPVLVKLAEKSNPEYLPVLPMVWSLAMGACLGGNGTLIGASANVVAAGIAQQHGYGFNFKDFFKVGFPMMLWTVFIATIYLLICHPLAGWNTS